MSRPSSLTWAMWVRLFFGFKPPDRPDRDRGIEDPAAPPGGPPQEPCQHEAPASPVVPAAPAAPPGGPPQEPCQHFLLKGSCKFGSQCRRSHEKTLVREVTCHQHLLGPDSTSKRKRFFCNLCGKKRSEGYRCVSGCDYDLCPTCFANSVARH
jgi:hypothetical protein